MTELERLAKSWLDSLLLPETLESVLEREHEQDQRDEMKRLLEGLS